MKKTASRITSVLLVALLLFAVAAVGVSAVVVGDSFKVEITADNVRTNVNGQIPLKAVITVPADSEATDEDFTVSWSSNHTPVATVNENGVVTGVDTGEAVITATVTDKDGNTASDDITVFIQRKGNPALNLLQKRQILGYRYNYDGDYFYTDDNKCWQSNYGFLNAFDIVCPYILLEYDYVRMHFNYGGKSWMIQLWKGQYGMVFYGSEIGVYYRDKQIEDNEDITAWTHYKCATPMQYRPNMEMTLYWDEKGDGNYQYQFTRPWDKYWWCTGFKPGHLRQTEPAAELRMVSTIELPDEGMADIFGNQLEKCGFTRAADKNSLELDSFAQNGKTIDFIWQNISEAESSTVVKATAASLFASGSFALIFLVIGFMLMSGLAGFLFLILI